MEGLFKTNIVIWSKTDLGDMDLNDIRDVIADGEAVPVIGDSAFVDFPEDDADWSAYLEDEFGTNADSRDFVLDSVESEEYGEDEELEAWFSDDDY